MLGDVAGGASEMCVVAWTCSRSTSRRSAAKSAMAERDVVADTSPSSPSRGSGVSVSSDCTEGAASSRVRPSERWRRAGRSIRACARCASDVDREPGGPGSAGGHPWMGVRPGEARRRAPGRVEHGDLHPEIGQRPCSGLDERARGVVGAGWIRRRHHEDAQRSAAHRATASRPTNPRHRIPQSDGTTSRIRILEVPGP